jgi:thaumarchaeosortase
LLPVGLLEPGSFTMSWNQGRVGLLIALFFLTIEYTDLVRAGRVTVKGARIIGVGLTTATATLYFLAEVGLGLQDVYWAQAEMLGLLPWSWVLIWGYLAYTIHLAVLLILVAGLRALQSAAVSLIYLAGMGIILFLDALFPYDTLGALHGLALFIMAVDHSLLSLVGVKSTINGNVITLSTEQGALSLAVFWPSAGVHSMIIYSLVIGAFLLKSAMDRRRALIYGGLGLLGTVAVNLVRVFLLSLYAAYNPDPQAFERFHSAAGELLFLPWLTGYLIWVARREAQPTLSEG